MAKAKVNIAHSVAQRMLNLHRETGERYEYLLQRYGAERLLYRVSQSEFEKVLVLKGASLFLVWQGKGHRATKDIDFQGTGESSMERMTFLFQELCRMNTLDIDGVVFNPDSVLAGKINEHQEHEGIRVHLTGVLERARIALQIDIGFGDVISPGPVKIVFPTLLDAPAPQLRGYPKETVFAEKFHAMVSRGLDNSRMKDFYDLVVMNRTFTWDEERLLDAIRRTFGQRHTELPGTPPIALTPVFYENPMKINQWNGFVRRGNLTLPVGTLGEVVLEINRFMLPLLPRLKV